MTLYKVVVDSQTAVERRGNTVKIDDGYLIVSNESEDLDESELVAIFKKWEFIYRMEKDDG